MSTTVDAADLNADDNFAAMLQPNVNVTVTQLSSNQNFTDAVYEISNSTNKYGTIHPNKKKKVDGNTLARRWEISSDKARSTAKNMTQRGVRSVLHPTISRRYPTNDSILCYKRMSHLVFSDTLKSGMKSARGNIYGQTYCTRFGWSIWHTIWKKGEAHETLYVVFNRYGVPPRMIVENY